VLQKVVDRATELIGARYGALSVPAPDGGIEAFITSGMTPEERQRIGPPPVGHGLLSVVLTELGPQRSLLDALGDYVERWREQSDIEAQLSIEPPGGRLEALNPGAELQLLRIIQEALANVRKHSGANRVLVRLAESPAAIEAVVEDHGRGFAPRRGRVHGDHGAPHFGLATMRERAESIGGTLEVESSPGEGTRVRVWIAVASANGRTSAPGG
jgi:signal transduction histidine kinase